MKKNKLLLIILSFVSVFSLSAQIDSIYYYNSDSTKNMYYVQKDMYSFRLVNGVEFSPTTSSPIIAELEHLVNSSRKMNLIKFVSTATETDIQNFISTNLNIPEFEFASKIISKDINAITDYTQDKFFLTNDRITIVFRDENITDTEIDAFMFRNGLALVHEPYANLPHRKTWSYFFRLIYTTENYHRNTIDVSRQIFENEYNIVKLCEPSMSTKYKIDADCVTTSEMDYFNDNTDWTAIEKLENDIAFSLFPNPANNQINIQYEFDNQQTATLEIYSDIGQTVYNNNLSNTKKETISIDVSTFSKGIYFVKLTTEKNSQMKKFIIQ